MGLFDFLRRKNRGADARELGGSGDAELGRQQRYWFAHYALRQLAFADPLRFIAAMGSDDAPRLLRMVWDDVTESCRKQWKGRPSEPDRLRVTCHRIEGRPCALIHFPTPRSMAEAHYAAVVLDLLETSEIDESRPPAMWYLVLEKGFTETGTERTVLCEWTAKGAHGNFGDGPPPTPKAFLDAVAAYVREVVAGHTPEPHAAFDPNKEGGPGIIWPS